MPGLEGALVTGPHLLRDLQGLLEPLEPLAGRRERHAKAAVLPLVPGRADAQPGAPARQHVERRHRLDEDPRMAVGHAGDQGSQGDPFRDAGRERERGVALQHLVLGRADHADLEEVVHHPETGEADLVSVARDPGKRRPDAPWSVGPGEVADLNTEFHVLNVCR